MNKVILGFRDWPGVYCPFCGGGYGAVEDEGVEHTHYLYLCWCGAKARLAKDDPDLLAVIAAEKTSHPAVSATGSAKGSSQHNEGETKARGAGWDN